MQSRGFQCNEEKNVMISYFSVSYKLGLIEKKKLGSSQKWEEKAFSTERLSFQIGMNGLK